ncbi:MAG TPA: hypothetical protein VLR88_04820 [Propionibacteriaceae bacterium]|nr:hypothetical protein [Propionibacteriaceae bacterium]
MIPLAINWMALLQVAITTLVVSVVVVAVVASAALALDTGHAKQNRGEAAGVFPVVGYLLLSVVAAVILFALYLVIPYFH